MHFSYEYALAQHAFACMHSDEVVILDLKHDRYLSVDGGSGKGLESHVRGWPGNSGDAAELDHDEGSLPVASQKTLMSLIDRGLVTSTTQGDLNDVRKALPMVNREWTGDIDGGPSIDYRDFRRFLSACLIAQARLRFSSLERLVRTTQRRRLRNRAGRSEHTPSVWQLLAKYTQLRPWFFSATDMCMFECLVVIEFLDQFNCSIDWVFGVRAQPFSAHCWVQYEDAVVNDTIENVCRFAPIMVV